jgi:hypothetical protein
MPGRQRAQGFATAHRPARVEESGHRLVGRPETAGVIDAHHGASGDHAAEDHDAVARRQDRRPGRCCQVDAAVPRPVGVGGRLERPGDGRVAGQGSGPGRRGHGWRELGQRGRRGSGRGGHGGADHQQPCDQERSEGHPSMLATRKSNGVAARRSVDGADAVDGVAQWSGAGWCPAGESHPVDRYAPRCDPSRRVDFARPSSRRSAGQSPPRSRSVRVSGAAGRQGGAPPGARDNRNRATSVARVSREAAIWQSSA